jgi:hypothetical protein
MSSGFRSPLWILGIGAPAPIPIEVGGIIAGLFGSRLCLAAMGSQSGSRLALAPVGSQSGPRMPDAAKGSQSGPRRPNAPKIGEYFSPGSR